MRAIQACSPECTHFLELDHLQELMDCYGLDCDAIRMESRLAKRTLAKMTMESTADVFKELSPLKQAFPTLVRLIQIALTICVSTASCERSFSAMKRIKTYLRSTMHEKILGNLALLSVEQEISRSLKLEYVIDTFCTQDENKRILLF